MKYTVSGRVCAFGAGQKLRLSAQQIDARRHTLEIVDERAGKVIAKSEVQFKAGETIDIDIADDDLPSSLAAVLAPASKVKKGKGKSKNTEIETDLDALEDELDAAERALLEACEKHGMAGIDRDPFTDEQKALIVAEAERLEKAKVAYEAAVGE